jgi:hypothetical protein
MYVVAVIKAKKHLIFAMPEHNSELRFNSLPEEVNHSFCKNITSRFIIKIQKTNVKYGSAERKYLGYIGS